MPSGQPPDVTGAVEEVQAESVCGDVGAAVGVPGVVRLRPLQPLRVGIGKVRLVSQASAEGLEVAHRLVQLCQRLGEHRSDAGAGCEVRLLRQVSDVFWALDAARVGCLDAGEQTKQRRLSDTALAEQTEALARRDRHVHAIEHGLLAVGPGQVAADKRAKGR